MSICGFIENHRFALREALIVGGRTKQGQAPVLQTAHKRAFLAWVATTAFPLRNEVMARLSFECGVRATEIGRVRWWMVYEPDWRLRPRLQLHASATKGGYGGRSLRIVPHGLGAALERLRAAMVPPDARGFIVHFRKQSVDAIPRSTAVQAFFRDGYDAIGLPEASSHSGRRTAITLMSRTVGLKNAQVFAGHRSLATTARYEEPEYDAIDRVVAEQLVVSASQVIDVRRPVMAKASLDSGQMKSPAARRRSGDVA
jgi:integrase/recombinase XerD